MPGDVLVDSPKFPPYFPQLVSGALIGALGWSGIWYLLSFTDPELGFRWLFFFCVMLALSGTSMPFVGFLNRRFPSNPAASEGVILRQAIWIGLYGSILVWLQQGRILNMVVGFFLAVGFILIETLLRMGENARWRPKPENENE